MICNFNTFALSKRYILVPNIVSESKDIDFENSLALQVQFLLMSYGKSLTKKAFASFVSSPTIVQETIASDIKTYLEDLFGNSEKGFDTLFGNYPNTVMSMDELEIASHTLLEYFTNGAYFPKDYLIVENDSEDWENSNNIDWNRCVKENYEMIDVIDYEGLRDLYENLLTSNQSLTSFDKDAIKYLASESKLYHTPENTLYSATAFDLVCDIANEIDDIPFKETLCLCIDSLNLKPKTITDVLRYAVYLHNGDVSLAEKTIFKKFTRPQRRKILGFLEEILQKDFMNGCVEMKKYLSEWIAIGEFVHPFEYKNLFPKTASAFDGIRNHAHAIKSWESKIDSARKDFDYDKLISLYKTRPGEFARAFDSLISLFGEDDNLVNDFVSVIDKVSVKVLIEMSEHFSGRAEYSRRYISPKNSRCTVKISSQEPISEEFKNKIFNSITLEIAKRFRDEKETLSSHKFFISKELKEIALPKDMRSAALGTIQIPRGSRLPIDDKNDIIRFYCHWIDEYGNQDLYLAAHFLKSNRNEWEHISWNRSLQMKRNNEYVAIFSEDVRHHKGNCAEYIDISFSNAIEEGYDYVVLTASDYESYGFLCPSFAGFVPVDKFGPVGEKTWSPEKVGSGVQITSHAHNVVLGVIDLKNREYIVVDEDFTGAPVASCYIKSLENIVNKYKVRPLWNAFNLVLTNVVARSGNFEVFETDEEVLNRQDIFNAFLEKVQTPENQDIIKTILDKTHFLTKNDFMKDYSLLLEYL